MSRPDKNIARLTGIAKAQAVVNTTDTDVDETDAVYIGVAGTLVVRFRDDPTTNITISGMQAGVWHPMKIVSVRSATAADDILVGWSTQG